MSLLAAAAFSSCVEENLAVFNPDETQAQVLGEIAGVALAADGEDLTATYDPAAFSVTSPVAYNFYLAPAGSEEGVKLASTIADGTITFKQKDLNSAILNLGAAADAPFSLDFWLVGYLCNDKGAAIAGTEVKSNERGKRTPSIEFGLPPSVPTAPPHRSVRTMPAESPRRLRCEDPTESAAALPGCARRTGHRRYP